jgi:NCAIR mutase (PurE)-related protein
MPTPDEREQLRNVLRKAAQGEIPIDEAQAVLQKLIPQQSAASMPASGDQPAAKTHQTGAAAVDLDRQHRCGFPEVVFCEGKTAAAIGEIFDALIHAGQDCLGTRTSLEQAEYLSDRFPRLTHNTIGRTVRVDVSDLPTMSAAVAVVTAGTSDLPVAEEAIETLKWMRCPVDVVTDVGVAGPHRLTEQIDRITGCAAVVVIAGMEGALPSIVGGHVNCPVIAVPTSVGYGASFGGLSALLGMLNSCAANVTVVNIDAGFKGGYVAGLIAAQSGN